MQEYVPSYTSQHESLSDRSPWSWGLIWQPTSASTQKGAQKYPQPLGPSEDCTTHIQFEEW